MRRKVPPSCGPRLIAEDNPVLVVDAFMDELDLSALGFKRVQQTSTGRPACHPAIRF